MHPQIHRTLAPPPAFPPIRSKDLEEEEEEEEEEEKMISRSDLYRVVSAMAPLYTAMGLGYASVRWWRVLSAENCAGIGRFVSVFAVPLLVFCIVARNNPYAMNPRLLLADSLQKLLLLAALLLWALLRRRSSSSPSSSSPPPLAWVVTLFSLATLPNTAIIGVPLLNGMYGSGAGVLVAQIIFPQLVVWYNLIIFTYEAITARRTAAARSENPNSSIGGGRGEGDAADVDITMLASEGADTVLTNTAKEEEEEEEEEEENAGAGDGGGGNVGIAAAAEEEEERSIAPEVVPVRKVMAVAVRKLLKVPSTYASFLGLLWSLIAFRFFIFSPIFMVILTFSVAFARSINTRDKETTPSNKRIRSWQEKS